MDAATVGDGSNGDDDGTVADCGVDSTATADPEVATVPLEDSTRKDVAGMLVVDVGAGDEFIVGAPMSVTDSVGSFTETTSVSTLAASRALACRNCLPSNTTLPKATTITTSSVACARDLRPPIAGATGELAIAPYY